MAEEGAVAGEEDIPLHADLGQGMETLASCLSSDAIPGTEAFQTADVESHPDFEILRADASAQQANAENRVGLMMGMNPDQTHYRGVAASAAGDARMSATGDVNTVEGQQLASGGGQGVPPSYRPLGNC
jgi:hypothetical protein